MEKSKLERINFLAREAKERELSENEKAEQKTLREEYIKEFRSYFTGMLDNTVIEHPDGTREKLNKKEK